MSDMEISGSQRLGEYVVTLALERTEPGTEQARRLRDVLDDEHATRSIGRAVFAVSDSTVEPEVDSR